ncbi:MAG: ATP-binding cassette domain-containing protein [Acidobacteriota bacterium]
MQENGMSIEISNVSKRFGDLQAVSNISLQIPKGSVYGILGPNGAGKTTTIRMILNIISPDEGEIKIMGESMNEEMKNAIGYLPEERGLYPKMKVKELLIYFAQLKGINYSKALKNSEYWLAKVELLSWKENKVEELSKGMQQKLQFIITLIHEPEIIILDEPFAGLDPINTEVLKDIMLDLKRGGKTILFSTHLMEHAEKLCDYVTLINKGKKMIDGKLSDIKAMFGKNILVLEFEGDGNSLKTLPGVRRYYDFGKWVELELDEKADVNFILRKSMDTVNLRKFDIVEPSLNNIFIKVVKGENQ